MACGDRGVRAAGLAHRFSFSHQCADREARQIAPEKVQDSVKLPRSVLAPVPLLQPLHPLRVIERLVGTQISHELRVPRAADADDEQPA